MRRAILTAAFVVLLAGGDAAPAQEQMYWDSNFPSMSLAAITSRTDAPTDSATARLVTTGDCELSADNSATAQLSEAGGDTLTTEYRLTFDGDGSSATGGAEVAYTSYGGFLSPAATVTHVEGDDDVNVTLYVRAQIPAGDVADAGSYSATQTITASWVGP
jgi:hypothetical protein